MNFKLKPKMLYILICLFITSCSTQNIKPTKQSQLNQSPTSNISTTQTENTITTTKNYDEEITEFLSNFPSIFLSDTTTFEDIDKSFFSENSKLPKNGYYSSEATIRSIVDYSVLELVPNEPPFILIHESLYEGGNYILYKYIDNSYKNIAILDSPAFYLSDKNQLTCFEGGVGHSDGFLYSFITFKDNKLIKDTVYANLWNGESFNKLNNDGIYDNSLLDQDSSMLVGSSKQILPLENKQLQEKSKNLATTKLQQALSAKSPLVLYGGKILQTKHNIVIDNNSPYMTIADYENLFNSRVKIENDQITITSDNYITQLKQGENTAIFQGNQVNLFDPIKKINGEIMIPISLASHQSYTYSFYLEKYNIVYIVSPDLTKY